MKDVGLDNLLALDGTEYTEENGTPYEFESAEQLLRDFFQEVNSIIQQLNNGDKK